MHEKISAIICTHNGQKTLRTAIQSLINQTLPKSNYQILVVDNASTDNTREIVRGFNNEINLCYICEPKLGLSNARNAGWTKASGEYVAYLDDDAIACPQWLERILEAFRVVPQAGAVGGKVDPIWEMEPPAWVNDIMKRFLTVLDWSETPIVLNNSQYLVGANISFPRKTLEKFSGFPTDLGRKGKNLISNEEIELINSIKKNGQVVYYHPEIAVQHFVPSSRLNPSWFRKRWFTQGISDAIIYRRAEMPSIRKKFMYAIRIIKEIIKQPQDLVFASFPHVFPSTNENYHESITRLGFLYGLFKTSD
jgi:glycosyltransferase involved in cell wall biosynthesis